MFRILSGTALVLIGGLLTQPSYAQSVSANFGFNSEYIYRGIPQKTSSAFGGVDYESGGFNLGTWAADVGDGAEIDYYGGYAWEAGDFGFSVGGTLYTYTGDFDDQYLELNLGASYKFLALDVAVGEYDNFGGPKLEYEFYSLTVSHNDFHAKIGSFAGDFDGGYFEAGYGSTLTIGDKDWLDYSVAVIHSDSILLGGASDTNFVVTLSKSFSLAGDG